MKTSISFTPFQHVYGLEALFSIKCEISSLKLAIELLPAISTEEERFLYLAQIDETHRNISLDIEAHQKRVKAKYDRNVNPRIYSKGDLVLDYDQAHDKLGIGKFEPIWHGPYIIKCVLAKWAYELVDYDGVSLGEPINGLYLKRYYSLFIL